MFEKQRQKQDTKTRMMNPQVSDLIHAGAAVVFKWPWQQNPEITKWAIWNRLLHFYLVASMEVDCHRDGKAKKVKDTRKLHPSMLFGNHTQVVCHYKKKKLACLVSPSLYPAGFSLKMKLQQTFWKSSLCKKSWLWAPEGLSHKHAFQCPSLQSLVRHNSSIRFSPTSFFLLFSPHPQFKKSKNFPALNTPYYCPSFSTAGNKTAQSFCAAPVTGHLQTGEEEGQHASG